MNKMPSLKETLSQKQVLFFTGKGGVGKSAIACASALLAQRLGRKVFLISWNPFDTQARHYPFSSLGITQLVVDGPSCFKEYARGILKLEKMVDWVLDHKIISAFVSAAPGLSETVIAGKVWDLTDKFPDALVLVDLPSSGHAYSFFSSPIALRRLFRMGIVHREIERICALFQSEKTAIQLVSLPEELPVQETIEFISKIKLLGEFHFTPIFLNQCLPSELTEVSEAELKEVSSQNQQTKELVVRFQILQEQEETALQTFSSQDLNTLKIPRLTTPEWITTVESISQILGGL